VPEEAGTSDAKKDRPLAEHKLVVAEDREIGVVSRATYAQYVRSGGSCSFACVGLLMVAGQVRRPLRPFGRALLAEIYLGNACPCHEINVERGCSLIYGGGPDHDDAGGRLAQHLGRRRQPAGMMP
jgi:hypothetical protein